jgi:hypothetical protein
LRGRADLVYGRRVKASAEQTADVAGEPAAAAVAPAAPVAAALVAGAARGRGADPLRQAAALRLQRTHGNAALSGWLARKPLPVESPIRGLGSAAIVQDDIDGTLYDAPDDSRPPVGKLAKDQPVTLIGTAGEFYVVEVDGKRAYVKQTGIATAIDTPGDEVKADWDKKLRAMSERLDKSGHTAGAALSAGGGISRTRRRCCAITPSGTSRATTARRCRRTFGSSSTTSGAAPRTPPRPTS